MHPGFAVEVVGLACIKFREALIDLTHRQQRQHDLDAEARPPAAVRNGLTSVKSGLESALIILSQRILNEMLCVSGDL